MDFALSCGRCNEVTSAAVAQHNPLGGARLCPRCWSTVHADAEAERRTALIGTGEVPGPEGDHPALAGAYNATDVVTGLLSLVDLFF